MIETTRLISTPFILLAVMQLRFGRLAKALANYDEALAIRPRYPEALNNRASRSGRLGEGYPGVVIPRSSARGPHKQYEMQ